MDLRLQSNPGHTEGLVDPGLLIHDIFLRKHVNDLAIRGNSNSPGRIDHALNVLLCDLITFNSNDSVAVKTRYVSPGNANINRRDLATSHQLRLFHGPPDRVDSRFNIHDNTFAKADRRMGSYPYYIDPVRICFTHHRANLCRTNVKANNEPPVSLHFHTSFR